MPLIFGPNPTTRTITHARTPPDGPPRHRLLRVTYGGQMTIHIPYFHLHVYLISTIRARAQALSGDHKGCLRPRHREPLPPSWRILALLHVAYTNRSHPETSTSSCTYTYHLANEVFKQKIAIYDAQHVCTSYWHRDQPERPQSG